MKCECQNCGYTADADTLPEADNILARHEIGDIFTDVQCPDCGSLCVPVDDDEEEPFTVTQEDVDKIVARAKALGAGPGLTHKQGQFSLDNYAKPHGIHILSMLIINAWDGKYDLIYAMQAVIEHVHGTEDVNYNE